MIRNEFEAVTTVLKQHAFLGDGTGGDAFGAGDLAFSSLSCFVLLPKKFSGGIMIDCPNAADLCSDFAEFAGEMAATKAGQHVRFCYDMYR